MTADAPAMTALAERCEQATGPDRHLAREVLLACGKGYVSPLRRWMDPTASLDAAITLVPEGMDWSAGIQPDLGDGKTAWGNVSPASLVFCAEAEIVTEASTPALALTAAALRALAQGGSDAA